jgi:DNA modification methylase
VKDGATDTYFLKTIIAMKRAGWQWVEQLIWHKPDAMPKGWVDRLRNVYESVHWLSRDAESVYCDPKATGVRSSSLFY